MILIKLPTFHAGQRYIYQNLSRFNLIVCGRRWRKTTFASAYMFKEAWTKPRQNYLWGSPTHDQNKIAFNYMQKYGRGRCKYNRSNMTIEFPSGSTIYFRSLNKPDNARGFTLHGVGIDEAAYINSESWLEVLRPTLMDTKGWGILCTTPNSFNWIFDLAVSSEFKYFHSPALGVQILDGHLFRDPHPLENDSLELTELQSLYDSMDSLSFRQEIMAEFLADTINVFGDIGVVSKGRGENSCKYPTFAGIDFAKTNDYTAISIMREKGDGVQELLVQRLPHLPYSTQMMLLGELFQRYNVTRCMYDATGVGVVMDEFLLPYSDKVSFQPFTYSNKDKLTIMNNMLFMIEKKLINFTDDKVALLEAQKFIRKLTGNVVQFISASGHDDTVNARALALWCQRSGGIF